MHIRFRCEFLTMPPVVAMHPSVLQCAGNTDAGRLQCLQEVGRQMQRHVPNYMVLTMGPHMQACEELSDDDGIIHVDHHFKPIKPGTSFHNEFGFKEECLHLDAPRAVDTTHDSKESHKQSLQHEYRCKYPEDSRLHDCITMWCYHRTTTTPESDTQAPVGGVVQSTLLGSAVVQCHELLQHLANMEKPKPLQRGDNDEKKPMVAIQLRHNFCDTETVCIILPPEQRSLFRIDSMKVQASLFDHQLEQRLVHPSMHLLPVTNALVRVQSGMVFLGCEEQINAHQFETCDTLGGSMLGMTTCTRLFGNTVCFTDMDDIVKMRSVQLPARYLSHCTTLALHQHGLTPEQVCNLVMRDPGTVKSDAVVHQLMGLYNSIITAPMSDSINATYRSDYALTGWCVVPKCYQYLNTQPKDLLQLALDKKDPLTAEQLVPFDEVYLQHAAGSEELWQYCTFKDGPLAATHVGMKIFTITEDQVEPCTLELARSTGRDDCESKAADTLVMGHNLQIAQLAADKCGFGVSVMSDKAFTDWFAKHNPVTGSSGMPTMDSQIRRFVDYMVPPMAFSKYTNAERFHLAMVPHLIHRFADAQVFTMPFCYCDTLFL